MSKVKNYIRKHCLPQMDKPKSLVGVLREANLISAEQMEMVLKYQMDYPELNLAEILSLQGLLTDQTRNFFARDWSNLIKQKERKLLGAYLEKAGLLEEKDIKEILKEQEVSNLRFGAIAVLKGYIKTETLEFFLFYLFPEELEESHLRTRKSLRKSRQRKRELVASIMNRKKSALV